jgi:dihydroxyacetone kinase
VATQAALDTKPMLAMRGRAAYTGERSRGSVDAGATAMGVLLQAISDAWREKYSR